MERCPTEPDKRPAVLGPSDLAPLELAGWTVNAIFSWIWPRGRLALCLWPALLCSGYHLKRFKVYFGWNRSLKPLIVPGFRWLVDVEIDQCQGDSTEELVDADEILMKQCHRYFSPVAFIDRNFPGKRTDFNNGFVRIQSMQVLHQTLFVPVDDGGRGFLLDRSSELVLPQCNRSKHVIGTYTNHPSFQPILTNPFLDAT